jgi:3-phosphoshikimate 1-carboxyvinyltransferase
LLVRFTSEAVSPSYMAMSLDLARQAGMQTKFVSDNELLIAQEQSVRPGNYQTEIDASSAFAIAALASVAGKAEIFDFPVNGLQPDCVFPKALTQLGVKVNLTNKSLSVSLAEKMKCINWNLKDCPDLFPILAVLCALAEGDSLLHGAPHLTYKESNRISKVAELLSLMDRDVDVRTDGLLIHGKNNCFPKTSVSFDPDQDHRLAMAAAIAQQAGFSIHLLNPECVNKSFPEFWEYLR